MRKTKIIATVGPSILKSPELENLLKAGVDVLRLNFSHLSKADATTQLKLIQRTQRRMRAQIGILVDLKGPEIRTDDHVYKILAGEHYWLSTRGNPSMKEIGVDHPALHKLVKKGQRVSMEDGRYEMKVVGVDKRRVKVLSESAGLMTPRRAVNLPRLDLKLPVVSQIDKAALRFVQENDVHWVAASFVNHASDVEKIRAILRQQGKVVPIISKIESFLAIQNIDEIIAASDGIMVARGDLGVDFDYEEIPILQDLVITKTREKGKVIIVATQMLESMTEQKSPRRAEVSDIAMATKERVDAVMLSGETATGKYPVESVQVMARIISKMEEAKSANVLQNFESPSSIKNLCHSGLILAQASESRHLICISNQGRSPKVIAAHRPNVISLVATSDVAVYSRCRLYYSICPVMFSSKKNQIEQIQEIVDELKRKNFIHVGEKIVFIFSHTLSKEKKFLRVARKKVKAQATNSIINIEVK